MSKTVHVTNTTKGGLVLPIGSGLRISGGEVVPVSEADVDEAMKNPIVRDWFGSGKLTLAAGEATIAPTPLTVVVEPVNVSVVSDDPKPIKRSKKAKE